MDKSTLEALKGSIQKWEGIIEGTEIDKGTGNCPLCQLFYSSGYGAKCIGCPVFEKTGRDNCKKTPYWEYHKAVGKENQLEAAQREVDFLKSLLPYEEEELKVEKEKILELAKTNKNYEKCLKELFPDAFDDEIKIDWCSRSYIFKCYDGEYYLLGRAEGKKYNFFSLKTGNRWSGHFEKPITKKFLKKEGFTLVEEPIDLQKIVAGIDKK